MTAQPAHCFILHSRSYLETSLLIDVFSREHGRLHLIAKGAKRRNSNFSVNLQYYQRLLMTWCGKNELMTLTNVDADIKPYTLSGEKLIYGFYINELLARLLYQHDPYPDLFDLYEETVSKLSEQEDIKENIQIILRIFEKHVLQLLGYALMLEHDFKDGHAIEPNKKYYYLADAGPTKYIPIIKDCIEISGHSLLALEKEMFKEESELKEIKHLLRFILNKYLGQKPLSSRILYNSYINI